MVGWRDGFGVLSDDAMMAQALSVGRPVTSFRRSSWRGGVNNA